MSPVTEGKLRLGGMALRNGLLVHGPTHWAAAVRDKQGEIQVASGRKPRVRGVDGVPGVRGVVRLGEAFAVIPLVKRALPAAKLPFESPAVIGVAAAASLGGAQLRRRLRGVGGESAAALISLAPAVFALRGGELAQYHGVEHKAIAAYEAPDDATDAADTDKEHDRCGSHLVAPMLASNVAGTLLLRRAVERPGPLAGGAVALASTAAAVEVFAWCERNSETRTARAIRRPGFEIQRVIGTREPDERQLEVGRAALAEILRVEEKEPLAAAGSRPRLRMDADVIVVGAGLAGLVATAELADAGRRVILLDQEPEASARRPGVLVARRADVRRQPRAAAACGSRTPTSSRCRTGSARPASTGPRTSGRAAGPRPTSTSAPGEKRAWLHAQGMRWLPNPGWPERGGYLADGHGNSVPRFHITWGTGPGVRRAVRAPRPRGRGARAGRAALPPPRRRAHHRRRRGDRRVAARCSRRARVERGEALGARGGGRVLARPRRR